VYRIQLHLRKKSWAKPLVGDEVRPAVHLRHHTAPFFPEVVFYGGGATGVPVARCYLFESFSRISGGRWRAIWLVNFWWKPRARRVAGHAFSGSCRSASARQNEARRRLHLMRLQPCVNTVVCAQPLRQRRMEPARACPTTRLEPSFSMGTGDRIGLEVW